MGGHGAIVFNEPMLAPAIGENRKPQPSVDVAFGEVEGLIDRPTVETPVDMAREVERVVQAFLVAGLIK